MKVFKKIIFVSLFFYNQPCQSANQIVGADNFVSSPQSSWVFSGVNNRIANCALMENGFTLEDRSTTCSFDSVFPVSGGFFLNSGKLYLNQDLNFYNLLYISGGGEIYANDYSIIFPGYQPEIEFLSGCGGELNFLASYSMNAYVNSVDWSFDDQYIVAGTSSASAPEVRVYRFDGSELTSVASESFSNGVNSIKWHPSSYYVAIGLDNLAADDIVVYYFNKNTNTFTKTSGDSLSTSVNAVAWSPDGSYLAVATSNYYLRIYSFSGGIITPVDDIYTGPTNGSVYDDSIDWCSSGEYIVIGTSSFGGDILVYSFNGYELALDASFDVGTGIRAVSWKKNTNYIAAGLSYTFDERIRIYEHTPGNLIEKVSGRVGESQRIYSLDWNDVHDFLAVGRDGQRGTDFRTYRFNETDVKLFQVSALESSGDILSVRWSHEGRNIVIGDKSYKVSVYSFKDKDLSFFDADLLFNSNVKVSKTLKFYNNCKINGNGKRIVLGAAGNIYIAAGSQLKLQNLELFGLAEENLKCLQNSASLTLENCKLMLTKDFNFGSGSILFSQDVAISGTNRFTYSTSLSSTINSSSVLKLNSCLNFRYAPAEAKRDLIYMTDESSKFFLNGCTLQSTNTGLRLTRGTLLIDNLVTFSNQATSQSEAICFGNGVSSDDLKIDLLADAKLCIYGRLEYENSF